jgi:H/ACA ribonucleoprotein complex subunit 4
LKAGKEYICLMHLHKKTSEENIKNTFSKFTGKIIQRPPVRSAVKRVERQREIYYLNILEIEDREVLFKVGCEAGTYIRKLVSDIGQELGTGAHMAQLIRTRVGPFRFENSHSLHEIKDAYEENKLEKVIQPIECAIEHLPKIWVTDKTVEPLCHGADLAIPGISKLHSNIKKQDLVAILTLKNELICLGTSQLSDKEIMQKEKGIAVKTRKVFMKRGTYKIK